MLDRIKKAAPYLIASGVILFVIIYIVCNLFFNEPGEKTGPGAVQIIYAKVEAISEDELLCYVFEGVEGDDALGFRSFDKGTKFVLRKEGLKFDIKELSINDTISFNLYDEELISDNKYLAHFGDVYYNDKEITYVSAENNIGE